MKIHLWNKWKLLRHFENWIPKSTLKRFQIVFFSAGFQLSKFNKLKREKERKNIIIYIVHFGGLIQLKITVHRQCVMLVSVYFHCSYFNFFLLTSVQVKAKEMYRFDWNHWSIKRRKIGELTDFLFTFCQLNQFSYILSLVHKRDYSLRFNTCTVF